MDTRPAGNRKLLLLQALRGLAALIVVFYHAGGMSTIKFGNSFLNGFFGFGNSGVDFFFVLSGFIIFYIHANDLGKRERLRSFLTKRLVRIYPIYWLINLTLIPFYFLFPAFGNGYETQTGVILSSLLLLPQTHEPILSVGWSLTHEILFYVCFALAIVLPRRLSLVFASIWALATLAFGALLAFAPGLSPSYLAEFILNAHNLEFLAGCGCAYLVRRSDLPFKNALIASGLALFVLASLPGFREMAPSGFVIAYGIPSVLLLLGCAARDIYQPLRVPAPFGYLGDASYSIYLCHLPVLQASIKVLAPLHTGDPVIDHLLTFVSISLSLLVGCLVHSWVEKPMLEYFRQRTQGDQKLKKQYT